MSLSDEYLKIMFSFHTHIEKIKLFCARKEVKGPVSQFGILGFHGGKLGFWDFALFEIGILEIMCEIVGFHVTKIVGFNPSEIGIWGFCPF